MRIVHCFFTFEMGGAQVLAVDLLNKLCHEHEVALIIVNNVYSEGALQRLDEKVQVHKINRKEGSRNPFPILKLNLLLQRLKPDIIHCHEYNIGKVIKAKVGRKLYTIHDVGLDTQYYHHFDALVAISDAVQHDVVSRLQRPVEKVYNGIDTASFKTRSQYKPGDQKIRLVQLSRLMHEKKGQDVLLNALSIVQKEHNFTNFSVDFIGGGSSREHLEFLVENLGLNDKVNFLGERDRFWLFEHLHEYHLLVQPSRYEGFGLTILEGFAAGLPVLASDIEGPAEIISHTPRGFLFRNGDPSDCAEKLIRFFKDLDNGTIEKIMSNSKSVTDTQYSIEACVEGYLKEYENLNIKK